MRNLLGCIAAIAMLYAGLHSKAEIIPALPAIAAVIDQEGVIRRPYLAA